MINETISVDAGPAISALDALAAAADKAEASFAKLKIPDLGAAAGGGFDKLVAQAEAAAAKIEASFARIAGAAKGLGDVGASGAAGLGKLADAENAAAASADRLAKSSAPVEDALKGVGTQTRQNSAWLDEYNATLADSAKIQKDAASAAVDANAKIAAGQRINTTAARDASAEAVANQKSQARAAEESAAAAETSSKKHSTAILVGAAAVGYGIYKAAQLQQQVTRLYTSAGEQQKNLPMITQGILKLSGATNTSQSDLAQGAYMVESAGFHGKSALEVLKATAQGAQAEGAPLGETGNALTSLMNAYNMKPGQATSAMNQIIAMVAQGKMTMAGAVGALPSVLPTAQAAGLNFSQVAGPLATMTAMGYSPDRAAQNIGHSIGHLQKPGNIQAAEMQMLGLDPNQVSQDLGKKGLTGTVAEFDEAIKKHMGPGGMVMLDTMNQAKLATQSAHAELKAMPPAIQGVAKAYLDGSINAKQWNQELRQGNFSARDANLLKQFSGTAGTALGFSSLVKGGLGNKQTQAAALRDLMGDATGMNVAQLIGGSHLDAAKAKTDAVAEAAKHAGQNIEGWSKIQDGFNFKLGQFKNTAEAAATTVGDALLPSATKVMGVLAGAGSFLADHPAAAKATAGAGGLLAAGYAFQRVQKPVTTALQGVGKIAETLHIPGLDKLANIGKDTGMAGASASLDGAGASLKGAAASLEGAAGSLKGAAGISGEAGALGAGGKGAAAAEGAAAGAAEGEAAAGIGARGVATTGAIGALAALTIVEPMLRGMKSGPGGKNWLDNPFGMPGPSDPKSKNNWLTSFSPYERLLGIGQPESKPAIPQGEAPGTAMRFGSSAAPAPAAVAPPVPSAGTMLGLGGRPGTVTVKPKVEPPDTGAIAAALAKIGQMAGNIKPVKMPAPDMSALDAAKGKAQAAAQGITQAMDSALHKVAKAAPPDLSSYASAAGSARADGANISAGLAAGIRSEAGAAVAAAQAVAGAVAAAMAGALQTHSPSRVTEKIGKDTVAGLVLGLQGGQDAVTAAANAIGKSIAKASDIQQIDAAAKKLIADVPKGDTGLTALLKVDNAKLDTLAQKRAQLETEITDAGQITSAAIGNASIMNATSAVSPAGNEPQSWQNIVQGMQNQADTQTQFTTAIGDLKKKGLNPTELNQLVQAGASAGLPIAQGIDQGGKQAISQLNAIQGKIKASASKLGSEAAPSMYQAGKDLTSGIAAGLKADLGSVDKALEKIAKSMTADVEKVAKTTKAAAKKAAAGTASDATSAAATAASGSSAAAKAAAGAGKDPLAGAAASLSASASQLSAAASALSSAAGALKGGGGGSGPGGSGASGAPHVPVAAGGGAIAHPVSPSGGGGGYGGGGYLPSTVGQNVHYHQAPVTVHVAGSVMTERDLLNTLQEAQLQRSNNNWQSGWQLPGHPN